MLKLVIVSPCYNEQDLIIETTIKLLSVLDNLITKQKVSDDSFILYVNDGSIDNTWELIDSLHNKDSRVCGINLATNVGHQKALLAGMMYVKEIADVVITIDADLQDDVNSIEEMINHHYNGSDIVYGIKISRNGDSWFKRNSAKLYYNFQLRMGMNIVPNHADFRLLSHNALSALSNYSEYNLYLRGIIPMLGLQSSSVDDIVSPRTAGNSKYTFKKMIMLAIDGITSFSIKPLEYIFFVGFLMLIASLLIFVYLFVSLTISDYSLEWASIMFSIWFIGSLLTMSTGIVGIYIGKMYLEVKKRPFFSITKRIGIDLK